MTNSLRANIEAAAEAAANMPAWMHYSAAQRGSAPRLGDLVAIDSARDARTAACVHRIVALRLDAQDRIWLDGARLSDGQLRTGVAFDTTVLLRR
jgi:hypothetical protein